MNEQLMAEKLEVLDGSRGLKVRAKAAVRLEDLTGLVQLSAKLKSAAAAGSTPTAAEHNALVADVKAISNALQVTIEALQARLLV